MIKKNVVGSNTAQEEIKFEDTPLSVKLTTEGRHQLEDIVNYLQINPSNAVRMAISTLHKDIINRGD